MNARTHRPSVLPRVALLVTLTGVVLCQLGCETRVVGAKGPGAGFYKIEQSDLRDNNDSVYGDSGVTKK